MSISLMPPEQTSPPSYELSTQHSERRKHIQNPKVQSPSEMSKKPDIEIWFYLEYRKPRTKNKQQREIGRETAPCAPLLLPLSPFTTGVYKDARLSASIEMHMLS